MNMKNLFSAKNIGIFILLIVGTLVVLAFVGEERKSRLAQKPGDCLPLYGTGKQIYYVKTDNPQNIQIVQVDVDPLNVKQGEVQKITVMVEDRNNDTITSASGVSASIFTDNKTTAIASSTFKLAKAGDEQDSSKLLVTTWEGYWEKDDSTCQKYAERITVINNKGEEFSTTLTFK